MELVVPSISVTMACFTRSARRAGFVAREALGEAAFGEMANPAVGLGEETDGDEARLRAHVEPVQRAVGHADQVALLAADLVYAIADVQGEQPRAVDEEAHLVFLVEVLGQELRAHCLALRVVR